MSGSQVVEPVSATDSQELFERWRRDRNREARDELIARFLPLARKLGVDPVKETLRLLEQHGFPPMDDWPYYRLLHEYAAVDSSGNLVELM